MKKAAVIGLGIGMAHVAGYLDSQDVELYAVCDLMKERLASIGGTFDQRSMLCLKPLFSNEILGKHWENIGVKCSTSIEKVMEDPQVDIVSICTPDYLHTEHLSMAMAYGKHILLEKPVSIHMKEAIALQHKVANYPAHIAMDYEFRVIPAIEKIKQLVESGEIGTVEAFSLYHFRTPFRRDKWHNWIQKRAYSGGLVIEETCHWFDLAQYLTGKKIAEVHCVTTDTVHKDFDYEDIAYINGTFEGGGIMQISHALSGFDFSLQITVHGTDGAIWCGLKEEQYSSLDNGSTKYLGIVSMGKTGESPRDAVVWTYGKEATEPYAIQKMVKSFCHRVVHDEPQIATFDDGCSSLKVAERSLQSAREKCIVKI